MKTVTDQRRQRYHETEQIDVGGRSPEAAAARRKQCHCRFFLGGT